MALPTGSRPRLRLNRRLIPHSTEPIGDQADGFFAENLVAAKGRHPVVALAVKVRMRRVADEANQPFARAVAGQFGTAGVFIFLLKRMTIRTFGLVLYQRAAFLNQRGIALIGGKLGLELRFGRYGGD